MRPEGLTAASLPEVLMVVPEAGVALLRSMIVEEDDRLTDDLLTVPEPVPDTEELLLPETVVPDGRFRLEALLRPP